MIPRFLSKLLSPVDPMPSADRARRSGPLSPERRARNRYTRIAIRARADQMRADMGLPAVEWPPL